MSTSKALVYNIIKDEINKLGDRAQYSIVIYFGHIF